MDTSEFADLLRRFRRRSGLTQEELAEQAGLSSVSVSLLERGMTRTPQRATVEMLSAALALSPEEAAAIMEAARRAHRAGMMFERVGEVSSTSLLAGGSDGSLPVPLTALIGRERDEEALLDLLVQPTTRLLTLTGPPGVGKTRLALPLAATLRRERRQDVAFVGLIPVQEPERVLAAIAQTLGIRDSGTLFLRDSLVRVLRDSHLMLERV
jgi:transcriptional regulator with XRE-family HTH domain